MFKLFYDIINGDLQPNLISDNDLNVLESLLSGENTYYYEYFDECKIIVYNSDYFKRGDMVMIGLSYSVDKIKNKVSKTKTISNKQIKALETLDIFKPPTYKAELYLTLIEKEAAFFLREVNSFLKNSTDIKNNKLFALKNLHILKELAEHLRIKFLFLGGDIDDFFDKRPEYFILYRLKFYIINLIQYIQKTFSTFCNLKIESAPRLKHDLFNEIIPRFPWINVYAYLKEDNQYEDFYPKYAKNYDILNDNNSYIGVPIGECLFDFYKSKYQDQSIDIQLKNYNEVLCLWNELLITNKLEVFIIDEYINEPEIEKILIPLLKTKIAFLENEVKMRLITQADTSSSFGLTGFKCNLPVEKKKNLFNYLINEQIIDKKTTEKYFLALLNEAELPEDFTKMKWILRWRNEPHKSALRDFFTVVLGEDNVPTQKVINQYITDRNGKPIILCKPKGNSNYCKEFEDVLKKN
jgi:hypothetical protein